MKNVGVNLNMRTTKNTGWIKLNNGCLMPPIGIGTWQIPASDDLVKSLVQALQTGYRYIDTAAIYENEECVAEAIKQSGLARKDLFICSKSWATERTYDAVLSAFDATLKRLQLDYLDCYMIHWPFTKGDPLAWQSVNIGTWRAFERLYDEGLVKTIGVSNFQMHHLVSFLARANVAPAIDQLEFHPGYMQKNTVAFCEKNGIKIQAWSPLAHGTVLEVPLLVELSEKYGKTVPQVILRWCRHHNTVPVVRAMTAEHQKEDLGIFDFELESKDIDRIDALPQMGFSGLEPDHVSF